MELSPPRSLKKPECASWQTCFEANERAHQKGCPNGLLYSSLLNLKSRSLLEEKI